MNGTDTSRQPHRLRADASRNRERIVAAAREALVERGPDIPLDEIARRAGVGNATLYRNFTDRRALIRTVTLSVLSGTAEWAEAALATEPDAFRALEHFVHRAADERIGALCTLLSEVCDGADPELAAAREHLRAAVAALVAAAQKAGQVRADIGAGDVLLALSQLTRPLPGTGCPVIDRFAHRQLQIFLDGLRAPARSVLPGTPATIEDLRQDTP